MAEEPVAQDSVANPIPGFGYSNHSGRPPGRLLGVAARVLPGVARVQADAARFAEAWERSNRSALEASGPLWVALGDSLSQGVGAPAYDRGWVGQLHARLASAGGRYRLVNLSVSGARSEDVLERQLPALRELDEPALVTLMIGSNDIFSRRHRRGVAARFATILEQLPAQSLVTTLPNPTAAAQAINVSIETAARRRGFVVADLRDPRTTSWSGKLASDHFHPNELGYAALTDVIATALFARLGLDAR